MADKKRRAPKFDTRDARMRLPRNRKPHYVRLDKGVFLGYRRNADGGTWVLRYQNGYGSYASETLGTADDVAEADDSHILSFGQAQQAAWKRWRELQERTEANSTPSTVRQAVEDYLSYQEAHGKSAADSRGRMNVWVLSEFGDMEAADLTTEQLRKWHQSIAESPARLRTRPGAKALNTRKTNGADGKRQRKATANRTLAVLKAALNQGYQDGKIPSDAAWRRVKAFRSVDVPRVEYLSLDECRRLINACDSDFRQLVRAALFTGCRYGELIALEVDDYIADAEAVHVRQSKSGKGRHVPLTDEGVAFFQEVTAGRQGDEAMFVRDDGEPWGRAHQRRRLEAACERARIERPVSFHILRHSYASHAVMSGAPLVVVATALGHADTRMVERHYGHLAPSYVADAIRAAAPRFGGVEEPKVERLRR